MSSASRSAQKGQVWSLLSIVWTPRCPSDGTLPPSSFPGKPRRKVSYRTRTLPRDKGLKTETKPIDRRIRQKHRESCCNPVTFALVDESHGLCFLVYLVDPNSILVRHKKFLKQLERQKNVEREDAFNAATDKENKTKAFKAQAQR